MALSAQGLRDLTRRLPRGPADLRRAAGIETATRRLLLASVMPLWLGAGLADRYLHRRTRIEQTAGPRESARHWDQAKALAGRDRQPPRFPARTGRTGHRHPAHPGRDQVSDLRQSRPSEAPTSGN
jgi:hypothetical protein